MNKIGKRATALLATSALIVALLLAGGCTPQPTQDEGPHYVDTEVIEVMGSALQDRFDAADSHESTSSETLIEVTDIEIDALSPYKTGEFEDSKLQEKLLAYLNLLDEMREAASNYEVDESYADDWRSTYDQRAELLKDFVDNYGLSVDSAHADALGKLVKQGGLSAKKSAETAAVEKLASSLVFEKQDKGYGYFGYVCTAANDTEYDFEYFSVRLALYDAEGVKAAESYAQTNDWAKGEKVRFETSSDVDAAEIKVTLENYSVEKA